VYTVQTGWLVGWFSHSGDVRGDTRIHRQHFDLISLLLFCFQNKESRLRKCV
jgi:hypothetical protein